MGVTDPQNLTLRCHSTNSVWFSDVTDPQSLTLWCHWPAEFDSTLSLTLRVWLYGVTDPQSLTLRCQLNILIFSQNCNQMRNCSLFISGRDRIDSRKKTRPKNILTLPRLGLKYKLSLLTELSAKVYVYSKPSNGCSLTFLSQRQNFAAITKVWVWISELLTSLENCLGYIGVICI